MIDWAIGFARVKKVIQQKNSKMPRTSKSDVGAPVTVENLPKFTVAKLKQELTSRNLATAGTKTVLIERLTEALESGELFCLIGLFWIDSLFFRSRYS